MMTRHVSIPYHFTLCLCLPYRVPTHSTTVLHLLYNTLPLQAPSTMAEKSQSKLYKFAEKQAVDMGMGDRRKGDRRPRMASSVTNLRDCERWRGEIMRDISRKVSKISDCMYFQQSRGGVLTKKLVYPIIKSEI